MAHAVAEIVLLFGHFILRDLRFVPVEPAPVIYCVLDLRSRLFSLTQAATHSMYPSQRTH